MLNNILTTLINKLETVDASITASIEQFLKPYGVKGSNLPFFIKYLPLSFKMFLYIFLLIIPVSFFKLLYPDSKFVNFILYPLLVFLALFLINAIFGFFQLAFTF
jgi:hypothetical protein